jgi:hypothetical protein
MIGLPLVIAAFAAISEHSADLSVPPLAPAADFSGWYLALAAPTTIRHCHLRC